MTTGIANLSRADYDALDAINWSKLKLLEKAPAFMKAGYRRESGAFRFGTAAHSAVTEPEKFVTDYAVYQGRMDKRVKAYQEFEAQALLEGKQVLSASDHADALAIQQAVKQHRKANAYLSGGAAEVAMTWTLGDFQCKGRADYIGPLAIVDFKTTEDASPREFAWSCKKYGYYGQAAFYADGYFRATGKRLPFVFVAVEKSAPWIVMVYTVPDDVLAKGREQYLSLLGKLDYCTKNNFWGGYTEAEELELEFLG